MKKIIRFALAGGTSAGLAMIPFGIILRNMGYELNKYGPLLLKYLFNEVNYWMILTLHILISWVSSLPLWLLLKFSGHRFKIIKGISYGIVFWALINAAFLPFLFNQSFPWQIGWYSIFPGLIVHVIYGFILSLFYKEKRTQLRLL